MYCILQEDRHPGYRYIPEIYGPYEHREDAENHAVELTTASYNWNGQNQLYDYNVREMTPDWRS